MKKATFIVILLTIFLPGCIESRTMSQQSTKENREFNCPNSVYTKKDAANCFNEFFITKMDGKFPDNLVEVTEANISERHGKTSYTFYDLFINYRAYYYIENSMIFYNRE